MIILLAGFMRFGRHLGPVRRVEVGKARIAFGGGVDLGDVQAARAGQGGFEQGCAADDADFVHVFFFGRLAGDFDGFVQGRADQGALGHAFGLIGLVAGQHQVQTAGQGAQRQAFPGLAPHQARLADGDGLETLQVAAQTPGQIAVAADHAVTPARDDQGNHGLGHEP